MTYLPDKPGPGKLIQKIWSPINLTWDGNFFPVSRRSSKVAKEGATRKHQSACTRKFVWDAHVNVSRSVYETISVEDLHPSNSDWSSIVDGQPGSRLDLCVAHVPLLPTSLCVSVNTLGCLEEAQLISYKFRVVGNSTLILTFQSVKVDERVAVRGWSSSKSVNIFCFVTIFTLYFEKTMHPWKQAASLQMFISVWYLLPVYFF